MTDKGPMTDVAIRKAAPNTTPYRITDHNGERTGLFLQVLPSGKKEFRIRYKTDSGVKMPLLGVYSKSFSLADFHANGGRAKNHLEWIFAILHPEEYIWGPIMHSTIWHVSLHGI